MRGSESTLEAWSQKVSSFQVSTLYSETWKLFLGRWLAGVGCERGKKVEIDLYIYIYISLSLVPLGVCVTHRRRC